MSIPASTSLSLSLGIQSNPITYPINNKIIFYFIYYHTTDFWGSLGLRFWDNRSRLLLYFNYTLLALIGNWILRLCLCFSIIRWWLYFVLNFRILGKYALFWLWLSLLTLNPINYLTLIHCLQSINILWIRKIHFFWITYPNIHMCLL